jgi:hypothetical protein
MDYQSLTGFLFDNPIVALIALIILLCIGYGLWQSLRDKILRPEFRNLLFLLMFVYGAFVGVSLFRIVKSLDMSVTVAMCFTMTSFDFPRTPCSGQYGTGCFCDTDTGESLKSQVIQEINTRSAYIDPTTALCSSGNPKVCAFADKTVEEQWYDMGFGTVLSGLLFGLIGVWLPSKSNPKSI